MAAEREKDFLSYEEMVAALGREEVREAIRFLEINRGIREQLVEEAEVPQGMVGQKVILEVDGQEQSFLAIGRNVGGKLDLRGSLVLYRLTD
jgi:hypothetical protein